MPEVLLTHFDVTVAAFAAAVERGPLDAPVVACPAWDVRQLAIHTGGVHRWAEAAARTGRRPETDRSRPAGDLDGAALAEWLRDGAAALRVTLGGLDPAAPTWHPFPVPKVAGVWPRRQTHETTIHCWDAEHAVGVDPTPIPAELAADGVDEFFGLVLPRIVVREHVSLPAGWLHVRCTDIDEEWTVSAPEGTLSIADRHDAAPADAVVSGSAAGVLGTMWRRPIDPDSVEVHGDHDVADAWLTLPGM